MMHRLTEIGVALVGVALLIFLVVGATIAYLWYRFCVGPRYD